jgi:hypothetical protein
MSQLHVESESQFIVQPYESDIFVFLIVIGITT